MAAALQLRGTQDFMGMQIPVLFGGFGEDKKCMSDKTVAEIHGQPMREIRKSVIRNQKRFKPLIDYIDIKASEDEIQRGDEITTLLLTLGYAKQSITQADNIFLFSERGYSKLIKIMDTDLAWEVHDQIMDEYFHLREESAARQLGQVGISQELITAVTQAAISPILEVMVAGQKQMTDFMGEFVGLYKKSLPSPYYSQWKGIISEKVSRLSELEGISTNLILSQLYRAVYNVYEFDIDKTRYRYNKATGENASALDIVEMNREIKVAFEELLQERMGDAGCLAESTVAIVEKSAPVIVDEIGMKSSVNTDPLRAAAEELAKRLGDTTLHNNYTYRRIYELMPVSWKIRLTRYKNEHGLKNTPSKLVLVEKDSKMQKMYYKAIEQLVGESGI